MYEHALASTQDLTIAAETALPARWQEQDGLLVKNGLVLLPFKGRNLSIDVWIGAEGPCYPGLAFRAQDAKNFELVYAQPHTSEQWDAIQYDPVFNGSNTWQIYHGPCYQRAARVPVGQWFRLRVDVCGERMSASVDGQPPLVVERLAHRNQEGQIGLWTYLPAYFSRLRAWGCERMNEIGQAPARAACVIDGWELEGVGPVSVEPHGVLNINRWLPVAASPARLSRRFEVEPGRAARLSFGFSDELELSVDGELVYEGKNCFTGFADYEARGYIRADHRQVELDLAPGEHELRAVLRASEPFGWGMALAGEGLRWL